MATLNRIQLMGNVGKDPESNYIPSGKMVAKFTLAVSNSWKDGSGEKKTETEWFNLEAWDGIAKTISQYVKKGSKLYVEGRIKTDKFEGKDGVTKYFTKVVVSNIQFLGDSNRDNSQQPEQEQPSGETPDEDSIPF